MAKVSIKSEKFTLSEEFFIANGKKAKNFALLMKSLSLC